MKTDDRLSRVKRSVESTIEESASALDTRVGYINTN